MDLQPLFPPAPLVLNNIERGIGPSSTYPCCLKDGLRGSVATMAAADKGQEVRKEDYILFIADKSGERFRARDGEILSWEYDEGARKFSIEFCSKPGTRYTYTRERVALYLPAERYEGRGKVLLSKNRRSTFSYAQLLMPDIETAPKIVRCYQEDGAFADHQHSRVAIVDTAAASGVFRYLERVEEEKARGGGDIERYLARRFANLEGRPLFDRAADSLLHPEKTPAAIPDGKPVIYPFGCNQSQMQAVENALRSKLSLIEGPPGTGKTQTILNIIANLLIRGKDVLVASPNNSATDNVREKLEREGLGFLVARLGSTTNQEEFLENQPPYPEGLAGWALDDDAAESLRESVAAAVPKLQEVFSLQRQLACDMEELRQWELQHSYFLQRFGDVEPLGYRPDVSTEHLRELRDKLTQLADSDRFLGVVAKIVSRFVHGIGRWADFKASPVELELRISQTIFKKETERLKDEVAGLQKAIGDADADRLMADMAAWSRGLLFDSIGRRYSQRAGKAGRRMLTKEDLRSREARLEYPVVTSTVHAAISQCGAMDDPFDYVIIDESSQCNLTTGFLALASARRAVVVGDTKQLPCVIDDREAMIGDECFDAGLDTRYRYSRESLLSSLEKCAEAAPGRIPTQLLSEHYRCHPAIIRFCNHRFYGDQLMVMRDERGLAAGDALTVIEVDGHDSPRDFNRMQAGVTAERVVLPLLEAGVPRSELGIVTPYRNQARGMGGMSEFEGVEIDTVHKFQGREKDVVAFVTRVPKVTRFVDDANLVNVSVSRAKERLALVASPGLLEGDGNIAELARYIKYQGGKLIQADEPSMFDLLYSGSRGADGAGSGPDAGGDADAGTMSEAIVEQHLVALLAAAGMSAQVGFVRNYPLKMFVPRALSLSAAEADFVDTRAHADFLFFRIVDKRPLAVLEVDGQYHDTPVQRRRDVLKDSIMERAGIMLRRLRTNEFRPEAYLEETVACVRALADRNGSAICHNVVLNGEGE